MGLSQRPSSQSQCVYPNCRERVNFEGRSIGYCPLSRHSPLFLCPYCRAPNRVLASFCRKCGEAISFVEESRKFDTEFRIQRAQLTTERCRIDLSAHGISQELLFLPPSSCFGFLLLPTIDGRLFFFNFQSGELVQVLNFHGEKILIPPLCNPAVPPPSRDIFVSHLFVFTDSSIFQVHLADEADDFKQNQLFTVGPVTNLMLHCQLILFRQKFFALFYDANRDETRLKIITLSTGVAQDGDTFKGRTSYPINIDERLFFYTPHELIFYDLNTERVLLRQPNTQRLDIDISPQCLNEDIYVAGTGVKLFRIPSIHSPLLRREKLGEGESANTIPILPINTTHQMNQMKFSARGNCLYISHDHGVLIMNRLGQIITQSAGNVEDNCSKFSPVLFGEQMAFTAIQPHGEILYLTSNKGALITPRFYESILVEPVISLGHLFLIVREAGKNYLKVYRL